MLNFEYDIDRHLAVRYKDGERDGMHKGQYKSACYAFRNNLPMAMVRSIAPDLSEEELIQAQAEAQLEQ